MIKKTITYIDLDGNQKNEDFWFKLTQAEFIKKAMMEGGEVYLEKLRNLSNLTEQDVANGGGKQIISTFEILLGDAVGKREGDLLIKSEEIRNRFMYSGAYDAFFLELISTPDSGATFMRNMLPKDAHEAIDKALAERGAAPSETPRADAELAAPQLTEASKDVPQIVEVQAGDPDERPAWLREEREPTTKELLAMPKDEMTLAFKMREQGLLNRANK